MANALLIPNPPSPLRRRRLLLGYEQGAVARAAMISRDTLRRLELGETSPLPLTAASLATVLDAAEAELFSPPNDTEPAWAPAPVTTSTSGRARRVIAA